MKKFIINLYNMNFLSFQCIEQTELIFCLLY